MISRIVKMTFIESYIPNFVEIFDKAKEKIQNSTGCIDVELLQDKENKNIFFTHIHWETENDLKNYKDSKVFAEIWTKTKSLFSIFEIFAPRAGKGRQENILFFQKISTERLELENPAHALTQEYVPLCHNDCTVLV